MSGWAATLDLSLDRQRVLDVARHRRWPTDDLGYLAHTVVAEGWGDWAPQPFACAADDARIVVRGRVTGFSPRVRDGASPEVARALGGYVVQPVAGVDAHRALRVGTVLSIASVVCPTVRLASACGPYGKGAEVDAWQAAVTRGTTPADAPRDAVYTAWFVGRLGPAFEVRDVAVSEAALPQRVRRDTRGRRAPVTMQSSEAVCWALVAVRDVEAAEALIARGIGRHRAFGLGWVGVRDGVARPDPWDPRPLR